VKSVTQPDRNTLETILVVDDQPVVREAVREVLERTGFCVLVAGRGAQAIQLERSTQGAIQLLISDVMMPEMSGQAVAERLEKLRPEIRVMLMSGYPDGELSFLSYGWHFIEKPFRASKLVEGVNEVLHLPALAS
jgi:two-component system, cell cycle sensor histidine kinase and response regulator CckA